VTEANSRGEKNGEKLANGIGAELAKKIKCFQRFSAFKDLSEDSLTGIAAAASFRHFKKGEYIAHEGDPPTVFRLIFEGRVKYFKEAASGTHFIVNVGHPGDAINSSGLIAGWPQIASVQALDDVIILWTKREDFLTLLNRYPSTTLKIIDMLHKVIASAFDRLIDLAGERAEQRICNVLYMLYDKFGTELKFSTSEIAELAGMTPETAIRILTRLKRLHIIGSHDRGRILVLDHATLKNLSRGPYLI
jgi:CRP/FNR family transcriptional regulator, anaerobic regulatory protein